MELVTNLGVFEATHTCFDDSLDLLGELIKEDPARKYNNEFVLVHGIFRADDGQFAHGWVENKTDVYEVKLLNGKKVCLIIPKELFYQRIIECTKYTPFEAWEENRRTVNYGPWIKKYLDLCGQSRISASVNLRPPTDS